MRADSERPSLSLVSFVLFVLDVLGTVAFLVHSLLARRRYGRRLDEAGVTEIPGAAEFFLRTPAPVYVACFTLFIVLLLVKEIAVDRKRRALRLNVAGLLAVAGIWLAWFVVVPPVMAGVPR